ncbi:hypothetical protein [Metabacillus halosaccharovorans]|uniref:hypothetical protein n=1 Tax=Metabacillus halosaccharovorans TaxID=930124 RepID=UPI000C80B4F5|nr:hypothetical protein [Metabacillus halosaccharovorans]MCM3444190.1 hypothetical protein [Metabacillus halosaccharovorans]PMC36405.1 hypothetical protein CJ195_16590 [Bacillus sp. UMB0899]
MKKIIAVIILLFGIIGGTGEALASSIAKDTMTYYTCYGVSQISKNSTYGVYGTSTTNCTDRSYSAPRSISVSNMMTRNGGPYDSDDMTYSYSDYIQSTINGSGAVTGQFYLKSVHRAVSRFNSGHTVYMTTNYSKSY